MKRPISAILSSPVRRQQQPQAQRRQPRPSVASTAPSTPTSLVHTNHCVLPAMSPPAHAVLTQEQILQRPPQAPQKKFRSMRRRPGNDNDNDEVEAAEQRDPSDDEDPFRQNRGMWWDNSSISFDDQDAGNLSPLWAADSPLLLPEELDNDDSHRNDNGDEDHWPRLGPRRKRWHGMVDDEQEDDDMLLWEDTRAYHRANSRAPSSPPRPHRLFLPILDEPNDNQDDDENGSQSTATTASSSFSTTSASLANDENNENVDTVTRENQGSSSLGSSRQWYL